LRRSALTYTVLFIGVAAYTPYLTLYYQSLGISVALIGALTAFTSATALLSAPVWGSIHDRLPRSRVLLPLAGLIAAGGGGFGLMHAGASPLLPLCAALYAVGMAGLGPMIDVRVLDLAGSDRTRYGFVRAFGSASFMIAAPLIGLLNNAWGLSSIFLVMIPAVALGSLFATTVPGRQNVHGAPSMLRAPGRVLTTRPIGLFLLGALVCWMAVYSQSGFFSLYLKSLGASADVVGWAWSLGAVLEIPTMVLFPVIARRVGIERLILLGACITVAREIANVTFTVPEVLLAFSVLQGCGFALLVVGGVTFVSRHAPRGTSATAQGLLSGATVNLAAIVGSGVGGQVAGLITIRGLYAVSVGLGILGIGLIALAVLPASASSLAAAAATANPPSASPDREPAPDTGHADPAAVDGPVIGA
jgi:MFS transporter, PPP family, 3-phenylpropionic acid transporter